MTDEPTKADHVKLREVIKELRSITSQLNALAVPTITSTADSRATRIADKAYTEACAAFKATLAKVAPVMSSQADSIEQWLGTTEAIQADTAKKADKLGKETESIPTPSNKPSGPKTIAGGTVNPDGTVSL